MHFSILCSYLPCESSLKVVHTYPADHAIQPSEINNWRVSESPSMTIVLLKTPDLSAFSTLSNAIMSWIVSMTFVHVSLN